MLQLGEPEHVEVASVDEPAVSLEEWLASMSKEGVGVHPYAFDGRQTPFFGADVPPIFGWCAASDRCQAWDAQNGLPT